MKRTFSKNLGRVTEDLELGLEEHLIYVHYTKGNYEKSACILKNDGKPLEEYLKTFFTENRVSEEMKLDVLAFAKNQGDLSAFHWKEFTNFLMKALSLHAVIGLVIALAVFGGYTFGYQLDQREGIYPVFTLIGLFAGLGAGALTAYIMVHKYFGNHTGEAQKREEPPQDLYPPIDASLDEVRFAVRKFSDGLPKGVYRTILVNDDNSIDYSQLAHILKGVPQRQYYMSKETYDLFEEHEKDIAAEMDTVQKAVDLYVKEHRKYPMLPFDPSRRVNYYQLLEGHYLKKPPQIQFYITDCDGLVTHIKPEKKRG